MKISHFKPLLSLVASIVFANMAVAHDEPAAKANSGGQAQHGVHEGTVSGVISDSMCKFDHTSMIKSGYAKDATACTNKCVKSRQKLVLCDKTNHIMYAFTNSKAVKSYAGKTVAVSGHIDADTKVIYVHSIKAK